MLILGIGPINQTYYYLPRRWIFIPGQDCCSDLWVRSGPPVVEKYRPWFYEHPERHIHEFIKDHDMPLRTMITMGHKRCFNLSFGRDSDTPEEYYQQFKTYYKQKYKKDNKSNQII